MFLLKHYLNRLIHQSSLHKFLSQKQALLRFKGKLTIFTSAIILIVLHKKSKNMYIIQFLTFNLHFLFLNSHKMLTLTQIVATLLYSGKLLLKEMMKLNSKKILTIICSKHLAAIHSLPPTFYKT